ncbi:hypothetical protein CBL_08490 [Carabus blaptoides fortunei]
MFQTNHKRQDEYSCFDTDNLTCPLDSSLEILLTNFHHLIYQLKYDLAVIFLPCRDQFASGCEFRNLQFQPSWYDDVLNSIKLPDNQCFDSSLDCTPPPAIPAPPKQPGSQELYTQCDMEAEAPASIPVPTTL